ncbi:MAG: LptF/LptG family permease [Rhodothermaceae bacterium]
MILFKYILRNHAAPFFFSSFVLIGIFLMQFLMKAADKIIGKGLDTWVIVKLVAYNLGWIVVLVIPMAVLVATLMAFGSMAQNNEVAIMKSSGISLYKMMLPPLLASVFISYLLIEFNNRVYPDTNHELKILMQDISRKKPTLSLVPGVFSSEVPGYAILARDMDPLSNRLFHVTIYDNSNSKQNNIITAKEGNIYFNYGQKKLILNLKDGEIHNYDITKKQSYTKIDFERHKIAMPGEQFTFQKGSSSYRSDREMSAQQMQVEVDTIQAVVDRKIGLFNTEFNRYFTIDSLQNRTKNKIARSSQNLFIRVRDNLTFAENSLKRNARTITQNLISKNNYLVEIHKKYTLPVACIVFILIGAPLGTMTRKSGFGPAAVISLIFFIIYWAFLIGGEKLADRGLMTPFWGMWSANICLGMLGVYLTVKSAQEKITFDFSFISRLIPKKLKNLNSYK